MRYACGACGDVRCVELSCSVLFCLVLFLSVFVCLCLSFAVLFCLCLCRLQRSATVLLFSLRRRLASTCSVGSAKSGLHDALRLTAPHRTARHRTAPHRNNWPINIVAYVCITNICLDEQSLYCLNVIEHMEPFKQHHTGHVARVAAQTDLFENALKILIAISPTPPRVHEGLKLAQVLEHVEFGR